MFPLLPDEVAVRRRRRRRATSRERRVTVTLNDTSPPDTLPMPRRSFSSSAALPGAVALAIALCATVPSRGTAQQGARQSASQKAGDDEIDRRVTAVMPQVITWRRDFHEHPELGNREFRTSKIVADYLRSLGMEVREGIAKTGVVGVLRGGKPGGVVALRSDMDALPVAEQVDVPFKSRVRSTYAGQDVGVMHACGHDAHMAMLLGAATVLAGMKAQLPGTVKFLFQPAEEGPPPGERGGAVLMIEEGALQDPAPTAIFGLHVWPEAAGKLSFKAGAEMSMADGLTIIVKGRQTHGAQPWKGVDPVVVSAEIITALQTITARQTDITLAPAIVTVATINGGVRGNIIPDSVVMTGTVRTFDKGMRQDVHARIKRTAEMIALASGATAIVSFEAASGSSPVYNDPTLLQRMLPTITRVADGKINPNAVWMPSEDYALYQEKVPGLFLFLGINKPGLGPDDAAANHSPYFYVNEDALPVGVKALAGLAFDYLAGGAN
jgi:amidohydrolase